RPLLTFAAPSYLTALFLPVIVEVLPQQRVRGLELPPALVRAHATEAAVTLEEIAGPELDERYEQVTRANRERMEIARGRTPDVATDREWVLETGAQLLFGSDPVVLRRYMRRVLCADLPSALHDDEDFMDAARAAIIDAGAATKQRRPSREDVLALIGSSEVPV
ncbi:MAG: hypothetical protein ABR552_06475, partial [Actinomycetota bacterium]